MKIVQIIPSLENVGGAETFVVSLTIELIKQGHDVTIISLYNHRQGFYSEIINDNKIKILYLNKKKGPDYKTAKQLKKLIINLNPDAVHSHLETALTFFLGGILKLKNITFVETIHYYLQPNSYNIILKTIIKNSYKRKKIIPVSISPEAKKRATSYYKINFDSPIIYNGINMSGIKAEKPINTREFDFIAVSRLAEVKNHQAIIKAAKILKERNLDFSLNIVGDGPLYDEISLLIRNYKLESNIHLLGLRNDVYSLLANHKIFLIPSFREGNPISAIEAISSGLAIIGTNNGGLVDLIVDDNVGFLVNPHDVEQLANYMELLLSDKKKLSVISEHNKLYSASFSISHVATQYIALYEKLIKVKKTDKKSRRKPNV